MKEQGRGCSCGFGISYPLGPSPFYMGVFHRKLDLAGDISWGLRQDMQLKIQFLSSLRCKKAGGMTNYWHNKTVQGGGPAMDQHPIQGFGKLSFSPSHFMLKKQSSSFICNLLN